MRRREYKTQWEAVKRRRVRESRSETITLELPLAVVRNLRAGKPYGWSIEQYVRRRLMIAFGGGRPIPSAKKVPVVAVPVKLGPSVARNSLCPCGSGRKFKACCGKAALTARLD